MIHYLVTREHAYTLNVYLETWGRPLREKIRSIPYEQLGFHRQLPRGAYVFADLERLSPPQMQLAARVADALRKVEPPAAILNDPLKVLSRRQLLTRLHDAGKNPFAVHSLETDPARIRFPVFVRRDNEHDGSQSDLLPDAGALRKACDDLLARGLPKEHLLIVELCNTADDRGVYRKFSAFRIGQQIVPRHVLFGRKWILKNPDIVDAAAITEEKHYLDTNPHQQQLTEIFDLAGITYGRIDYSLLNNQLVTWEINTNPMIIPEPMNVAPNRLPAAGEFARHYETALAAIDHPADGPAHPLHLPRPLRHDLGITLKRRLIYSFGHNLRNLKSRPAFSKLLRGAGR